MASCESDHLDQFYDVIRIDVQLTLEAGGWVVTERHRHETGQMGRCRASCFDRLTAQEACAVADAVVCALLPSEPPPERRSTL